MIDHHAMSREGCGDGVTVPEKAVHKELQDLCQDIIIITQQQEMETMQSWLFDWYGITYEPQMN